MHNVFFQIITFLSLICPVAFFLSSYLISSYLPYYALSTNYFVFNLLFVFYLLKEKTNKNFLHSNVNFWFYTFASNTLFLLFAFGHPCATWKFLGQGSNPCHKSNQGHSSEKRRSLISCTTRELSAFNTLLTLSNNLWHTVLSLSKNNNDTVFITHGYELFNLHIFVFSDIFIDF